MSAVVLPETILDFWIGAGPEKWFKRDDAFDQDIHRLFLPTYKTALDGRLNSWMGDARGALALVIVLDQFARNLFRDDARAWAGDSDALAVARQAIERRFDLEVPEGVRRWFYMPFMHAEDLSAQQEGLGYFAGRLDDPETLKFAELHLDIIQRFGRFPHRNAVLGRPSSEAEQRFLDEGGFAG